MGRFLRSVDPDRNHNQCLPLRPQGAIPQIRQVHHRQNETCTTLAFELWLRETVRAKVVHIQGHLPKIHNVRLSPPANVSSNLQWLLQGFWLQVEAVFPVVLGTLRHRRQGKEGTIPWTDMLPCFCHDLYLLHGMNDNHEYCKITIARYSDGIPSNALMQR